MKYRKFLWISLFLIIFVIIFKVGLIKHKKEILGLNPVIAAEKSDEGSGGGEEKAIFNPEDYLKGTEKLTLPKSKKEIKDVIVDVINYFLTFLTLIGIIIIIVGGIMWATSMGNEEKVSKAKKMIIADIIGLAVVLLSWMIVNYVLTFIKMII